MKVLETYKMPRKWKEVFILVWTAQLAMAEVNEDKESVVLFNSRTHFFHKHGILYESSLTLTSTSIKLYI